MNAEALSATPAAQAALEALRAAAGQTVRWSATDCASSRSPSGLPATGRSIASCCCAPCRLHDVGLFTHSRDPYVTEGARLAARVLEPFDWPPQRLQRCMDACEQHHAPRSRMAMGLEVELERYRARHHLFSAAAGRPPSRS